MSITEKTSSTSPPILEVLESCDLMNGDQVRELICVAFAGEPKRLRHVLRVADQVRGSVETINSRGGMPPIDQNEAYCAALLHDIGYVSEIVETGFHPVDGARYLEQRGYPRLAELILGHSNSPEQAELRGLSGVIASDDFVAKLITYWDVQVMQGGELADYETRLADIRARHGAESKTWRAHELAGPRIRSILSELKPLLQVA